jgi:alpha-galactosidase
MFMPTLEGLTISTLMPGKQLMPGESYETVPVAIGCVSGGFEEAVAQLTKYRRRVASDKPSRGSVLYPVIFNDYMNCLWGDPTETREIPMIEAAAAVGCEYYVIDAGWYAALHEDWSQTLGAWLPSTERFPKRLPFTLKKIRSCGMIPGLWLEPDVAGRRSELAKTRPESWFLQRHGRRVLRNSRYMLDFRNSQVTNYLTEVVHRLVDNYGVGYIKMDYNVNTLIGTDLSADSPGQGLLDHNRAVLRWLDEILERFPHLVIENCGSGGGRMDYAMLSRLQIQSMTDQEDYRRLPAILVGVTASVLPEQTGVWSYPLADADADQASFNMVTALTCRIHQSGRLDRLSGPALKQVTTAIALYKTEMRHHVAQLTAFYPLGLPALNRPMEPIVLGMRGPGKTYLAVWRLEGDEVIRIPVMSSRSATLLYPSDLGITVEHAIDHVELRFPRPYMACVLSLA